MKTLIIRLVLIGLITFSCLSPSKKMGDSDCYKNNYLFTDRISEDNDISISFSYNKKCVIDSLFMKFKLDKRSYRDYNNYRLKKILIEAAYIDKDTTIFINQKVINNSNFKNQNRIVNTFINILDKKIDSINYITIQTIGIQNEKNILSHLYTYKNSLSLIEMQKSYLDYKAFLKKNITYKILSTNKTNIKAIQITVKTKNIDSITNYSIILNDKKLDFNYSINASYDNFKKQDKGCLIYNVIKLNSDFLSFKLNIQNLKIEGIQNLEVSLNKIKYK